MQKGDPHMPPAPDAARRLAAWLNYLFLTHLTPTGRPWTFSEVGKATDLSSAYIRLLRIGSVHLRSAPSRVPASAAPLDNDDTTGRSSPPPLPQKAY